MGCWNETCAISRMSISAGEAVRLLPIVMNPHHIKKISGLKIEGKEVPEIFGGDSGCYIGDLWTPLCYPIRGDYNDYGTIENIPDKTHKDTAEYCQFTDAFKKYCVTVSLGKNQYHDAPIQKYTMGEILDALREGHCYMNYKTTSAKRGDRLVPIAWMMIKESVWQSLLETDVKKSGEVWSSKGEKDRYSLKGIREGIVEMVETARKSAEVGKIDPATATTEEIKKMLESIRAMGGFLANMTHHRSRVWNMSPIEGPAVNEDLIDIMTEMEYIHSMMSILRISFAPTTGSGSQCNNYKLWKLVNKKWNTIITTDLKQRDKEEKEWKAKYKEIQKKEAEEKA